MTDLVIIGSDRPRGDAGRGPGVSAWSVDPVSGAASLVARWDAIDNVLSLAAHPSSGCVYASGGIERAANGSLTALRLKREEGMFERLSEATSQGDRPAHLALDGSGQFLMAANYGLLKPDVEPGMAASVHRLMTDGRIGPLTATVRLSGSGAHPRQDRSHPHAIRAFGSNRFVAIADIGTDRVTVHAFDPHGGIITDHGALVLPPGTGPRHIVFHPGGRLAWVSCELSASIACLAVDPLSGIMSLRALVPCGGGDEALPSELCLSPDGRFLVVALRQVDRLATFAIEPDGGLLRLVDLQACGGAWPVHAAFDPSGRFFRVSNMRDGVVAAFAWGFASGRLIRRETGDIRLYRPSWIATIAASA